MSQDPNDAATPPPEGFEVFRRDGSTQLPGQRFPKSAAHESAQRSGPVEQRLISDGSGAPLQSPTERGHSILRDEDGNPVAPHAEAAENSDAEPITVRMQTYQVNLAERIARVKAGQQEVLGNLQQLEDDNREEK